MFTDFIHERIYHSLIDILFCDRGGENVISAMISEIEAKPLDLRVKCEPEEANSESDDAEDIKPIYMGYKKCIIKQFRKCLPCTL